MAANKCLIRINRMHISLHLVNPSNMFLFLLSSRSLRHQVLNTDKRSQRASETRPQGHALSHVPSAPLYFIDSPRLFLLKTHLHTRCTQSTAHNVTHTHTRAHVPLQKSCRRAAEGEKKKKKIAMVVIDFAAGRCDLEPPYFPSFQTATTQRTGRMCARSKSHKSRQPQRPHTHPR